VSNELAERLESLLDRTDLLQSDRNAFIAAFVHDKREQIVDALLDAGERKVVVCRTCSGTGEASLGPGDPVTPCPDCGLRSPAAALAEMREALKAALETLVGCPSVLMRDDEDRIEETIGVVKSALAATEGSKPDTDDTKQVCQAGKDGECNWTGCPQKRDYKPWCPLAGEHDEDL